MLKILTPNKVITGFVFAPVFYFIASLFIPSWVLREIFNSLSFGVYVMISITWLMSFFIAIKNEGDEGKWRLILGIYVLAFTVTETRVYSFVFNYLGRPDWIGLSPLPGFFSFSYFMAGILILSAVLDEKERPILALKPLLLAIAIGSASAGAVFALGISAVL